MIVASRKSPWIAEDASRARQCEARGIVGGAVWWIYEISSSSAGTELTHDDGKAVGRPWDTSDPFVSAYTRDLIVTVFKCYIRHIILYIGIPGNIICCVVFWKVIRLYVACGTVSGNLNMVMSVERCLLVVTPFKARRLLSYGPELRVDPSCSLKDQLEGWPMVAVCFGACSSR
ncbi:hypothetical protein ACOMHN_019770 [Nucella lapillus]